MIMINSTYSAESIAHRGASGYAPENTLSAIKKAIELGSQYIEIDVHMSLDNEVLAIHDSTLNRTTDGKGKVRNLSLTEIRKLDAGKWFSQKYRGEKVPTLKEVLSLIKGKTKLIIELKYGNETYPNIEQIIANDVQSVGLEDNVIFKSFDTEILNEFERIKPEVERLYCTFGGWGFLTIDNFLRFRSLTSIRNVQYYQIHKYFINKSIIKKIHDLGKKIVVWDVHEVDEIAKMKKLGVDLIETDYPDRVDR